MFHVLKVVVFPFIFFSPLLFVFFSRRQLLSYNILAHFPQKIGNFLASDMHACRQHTLNKP